MPVNVHADVKGKIELTECDGANDWQLNCPNNCQNVDDSLRLFIANPERNSIAVWGDHDSVWTGEGPQGLMLLVMNYALSFYQLVRSHRIDFKC